MKQNGLKGEWVRSSSTPSRQERLKDHDEFMASKLKEMLDNDWEIRKVKVRHRRPRIHKPKEESFKVVIILGKQLKLTIGEYNNHYAKCNW